jgi:hypothetical protein
VDSISSPKFNLSRLKALRSLEVDGWGNDFQPTRHTIVIEVFSTITSPAFSELVILIGVDAAARLPSEVTLFETLRAMNKVRPFKLVFLLMAPRLSLGEAHQKFAGAFDSVIARGLFDFLDSPPIFRSDRFREQWWDTSSD